MPVPPTTTGPPWDFATARRTVDATAVWNLWTTPATWASWDRGLTDARLDSSAWQVGATGTITDLRGRRSRFEVTQVDPGRATTYRVALPGAGLLLQRTVTGEDIAHRVRFTGPAGRVWGVGLGRRFRALLDPTVDALLAAARTPHG